MNLIKFKRTLLIRNNHRIWFDNIQVMSDFIDSIKTSHVQRHQRNVRNRSSQKTNCELNKVRQKSRQRLTWSKILQLKCRCQLSGMTMKILIDVSYTVLFTVSLLLDDSKQKVVVLSRRDKSKSIIVLIQNARIYISKEFHRWNVFWAFPVWQFIFLMSNVVHDETSFRCDYEINVWIISIRNIGFYWTAIKIYLSQSSSMLPFTPFIQSRNVKFKTRSLVESFALLDGVFALFDLRTTILTSECSWRILSETKRNVDKTNNN